MARLLTLLLVTRAAAEWVEISQQHYRKPLKTHSVFTTPDKVTDVEETTKPWTYNNRSVAEYNWNKTPARPTNMANIKRVQHTGSTVKPERVKEDDDLDLHVDFRDYELRPNYGPSRATIELHYKQKGMAERVPNVGKIKRVELDNSPVKSPAVNYKGDGDKYSNNRHEDIGYDDHHTEANEYEHKKNTEAHRRIYVNKVKHHHSTERTATFPPEDDEDNTSVDEEATAMHTERPKQVYKNHTTVRDFYTTKPTFITETEDFTSYEAPRNRFHKIIISGSSEMTEFTTEIIDTEEKTTKMSPKRTKPTNKPTVKSNKNNVHQNDNDFKAESHENRVYVSSNDEKTENPMINEYKTKPKGSNDQPKPEYQSEKEIFKEIKDKAPTLSKTEKNKVNTMENVIKFMRVVADTIFKNSRRSFGGKMQYLHELKEFILANIEERIDATWPDDDSAGARRRSRSAHATPRGHVQFPSSESALMTISFLTFAVFLIKLVLQVIQTYKHKTMMVAPLMVASGRNIFSQHGHHGRK
ncbi:hypothetical protein PYW07_007585 [Mythimna separata]|uniref:Uncharacterized protein n=1 Tax=Mythimna separata TaxID=271217 RepID=A0AAD8DUW8_MYTSE|nr:hypothetical protein PYW07_007585 [Mythimna separata]